MAWPPVLERRTRPAPTPLPPHARRTAFPLRVHLAELEALTLLLLLLLLPLLLDASRDLRGGNGVEGNQPSVTGRQQQQLRRRTLARLPGVFCSFIPKKLSMLYVVVVAACPSPAGEAGNTNSERGICAEQVVTRRGSRGEGQGQA